jgi:hypothetical protein
MKDYSPQTSTNHRMQIGLFFGNFIIFIGGFAFFEKYPIAGYYGLEQLFMLAYFVISNFAFFVYYTHSVNKYTIRQSILITITHLTTLSPDKPTVANCFILSLKEKNNV